MPKYWGWEMERVATGGRRLERGMLSLGRFAPFLSSKERERGILLVSEVTASYDMDAIPLSLS
ncbi:hypothetical protein RJ641_014122 [Dillenia turbinata]|uniref:Uncharacterized protein n=1 Tax=Dillenia turbinata TaxID=194707 RepID=A0AAN8YZ24_9MAGN